MSDCLSTPYIIMCYMCVCVFYPSCSIFTLIDHAFSSTIVFGIHIGILYQIDNNLNLSVLVGVWCEEWMCFLLMLFSFLSKF